MNEHVFSGDFSEWGCIADTIRKVFNHALVGVGMNSALAQKTGALVSKVCRRSAGASTCSKLIG